MLGNYAKQRPSSKDAASDAFMDDSLIQASDTAVAALGPGSVFGELALVNGDPRNATISCWTDCEFLIIEKADFDGVVKAAMKREKDKKVKFLRSAVPGMRDLPQETVDRVSYYFTKMAVPRNHFFFEQGQELNGSIYFIWQGSVESYQYDPDGGFARRANMLTGSVFAAVPQGTPAFCSVVSTSSPCEVLHVNSEDRLHLPDVVIRKLREVLDQTVSRRSNQCLPLSPMGGILSTALKPQVRGQLLRTRIGKVPRPLAGKFPPIHIRANATVSAQHKVSPMRVTLPSFTGLFEAKSKEVDYEVFELNPGETIAARGRKPKKRTPRAMRESLSLPALG